MPHAEQSPSEEFDEVVALARAGDREALESVLLTLAPSIRRFGLRMCKNEHDAEDALQETLISVAQQLDRFEGRSSLTSWAFTITRSACARRRRGLKNQPHLSDVSLLESPDPGPSPEDRVAQKELASALSSALDRLPVEHREVIVLRDMEGLSASEAAASIGISVGALKSRLHRAREALRDQLAPEPPKAGCADIVLGWSMQLEGELSAADCKKMERHIESCSECGAACETLRRVLGACEASRTEVPPEVQASVKAAIHEWMTRPGPE